MKHTKERKRKLYENICKKANFTEREFDERKIITIYETMYYNLRD